MQDIWFDDEFNQIYKEHLLWLVFQLSCRLAAAVLSSSFSVSSFSNVRSYERQLIIELFAISWGRVFIICAWFLVRPAWMTCRIQVLPVACICFLDLWCFSELTSRFDPFLDKIFILEFVTAAQTFALFMVLLQYYKNCEIVACIYTALFYLFFASFCPCVTVMSFAFVFQSKPRRVLSTEFVLFGLWPCKVGETNKSRIARSLCF